MKDTECIQDCVRTEPAPTPRTAQQTPPHTPGPKCARYAFMLHACLHANMQAGRGTLGSVLCIGVAWTWSGYSISISKQTVMRCTHGEGDVCGQRALTTPHADSRDACAAAAWVPHTEFVLDNARAS